MLLPGLRYGGNVSCIYFKLIVSKKGNNGEHKTEKETKKKHIYVFFSSYLNQIHNIIFSREKVQQKLTK